MATALEHCFIREQGAGRVQLLVGGRKQADGLFTIGVLHDIVQESGQMMCIEQGSTLTFAAVHRSSAARNTGTCYSRDTTISRSTPDHCHVYDKTSWTRQQAWCKSLLDVPNLCVSLEMSETSQGARSLHGLSRLDVPGSGDVQDLQLVSCYGSGQEFCSRADQAIGHGSLSC